MSQVLTPEEMAALYEGLRQAEHGSGPLCYQAPQETPSPRRIFSEPRGRKSLRNFSAWLMVMADLRWPNL